MNEGLEQRIFRKMNTVVEPAVRSGIASPPRMPGALIVLESIGFKTGKKRRTPLLSFKVGRFRIISTVRGNRSFWVKNLLNQPSVEYFVGGKLRSAHALVLMDGKSVSRTGNLSGLLAPLVACLSAWARNGVAIVVLAPPSRLGRGAAQT